MSDTSSQRGRRRTRQILTAAAVLLSCLGVVTVGVGIAKQDPAPPSPPSRQAASSPSESATPEPKPSDPTKQPASPAPAPEGAQAALDYSAPVSVTIPKIDVSSSLVDLGLDENGAMEVPKQVDKAGWFTPSPPPGIPGSTVISGHVTWDQEPVVFFKLGDLRKGDRVEVEREDGVNTVFEVYRIGSFPKEGFPTDAVYDRPDQSELRLITCGGEYDSANNRYLSNVIVWAKMVSHT